MPTRMTVIGTGYLGVTHAACLAELGYHVVGLDTDEAKVAMLADGRIPFYEPELEPLLRKHIDSGRLRFTTSYADAAAFGDVHFICVGTPQRTDGPAADLRFVHASVESLAPLLERPVLVVGKSTVPVGTARWVADRLHELAPAGTDVDLVWNPEFLREGFAVQDTLRPDRLVIGSDTTSGAARLRQVYQPLLDLGVPLVETDLATAELVKAAANSFLATKISFINAMAEVCETTGADVVALAEAIGYDERIGKRFLNAGLGFGGGCLPKDIRAFMARAEELGVDSALNFLKDVDAINNRRRSRMVDLARTQIGGCFEGCAVAVLGAAFKPDSDDIRDSPALDVASRIAAEGGHVQVYDPKAMDNARIRYPDLTYAQSVVEAGAGADVVLHLTEWREFVAMDPDVLGAVVRHKRIVDGRNALDAARWRAAGWTYRALGRPDVDPA
ncbi:MAG: UDP-glucose/GDP-mannose dehydrogenase family protein [Actinomycetota bacterium]|nr:UDP-glucose/GDP-mannose dehydrogenase family protein [Actinomycetota bacterium]